MMQTLKVSLTLMNAKCQQLVAKRVYPIRHECRCISYVSNVLYYICNIDTGILPSRAYSVRCPLRCQVACSFSAQANCSRASKPWHQLSAMAVDLRSEPSPTQTTGHLFDHELNFPDLKVVPSMINLLKKFPKLDFSPMLLGFLF